MAMIVEITIKLDDGTVVMQKVVDALKPNEWKTHQDHPVVQGDWRFFGWTYQPRVVLASKAGGF
jgi:hypothetical protein